MGKKYIIELEDKPFHKGRGDFLYRVKGFNSLVFDMTGIGMLTPYIEPDLEQIRKERYEKGYHAGYVKYLNKSFDDGLKASWEVARYIIFEMDHEDYMKIFGGDNLDYIFALSPTTVIEKLKAYEQEQEEIRVGDEVVGVFSDGKETRPFVFIRGSQEYYFGLYSDTGEFCQGGLNMRKTGRSFPEIITALEKMRGEQE